MSTYSDYHRTYYREHKAEVMQYNAELRALRKRMQLCRDCGRQDAYTLAGHTKCADCVERDTMRRREKRGYKPAWMREKKQRPEVNWLRGGNGICWQCNKRPKMEGKQLCPSCYEKKIAAVTPNLAKCDRENHPWRKAIRAETKYSRASAYSPMPGG